MNSLSTQRDVEVGVFMGLGRIVSTLVLGVAVAGCAAMNPRTPQEAVKERSQARWDALVKGDVKGAYAFFSPGSRAVETLEDYAPSIRRGFWKSAVVEKAVCESSQACEAHVTIEYEFQRKRARTLLRETWIQEGTDWWYVKK